MKKLVAETLFELYGPGYVSDLASGNAKKKDGFKHDTKRPFPPESDEEKEKFDQSDEDDDNIGANEWPTNIPLKYVGQGNTGISAGNKVVGPHKPIAAPYNDDDDQNTGADGPDPKAVPYVNLAGKPHGFKTGALLKAINDSPDGFSRTQIQKFLVDGTYGKGTWDKAEGTSEIYNYKGSGDPTTRKANPYRGYWGMALSQNRGFLAQYLTKKNPEMVDRKSQAFSGYGQTRMEKAMTRKGKWILSAAGKATLKKYQQKFKDL